MSMSSSSRIVTDIGGNASADRTLHRVDRRDAGREPGRQHHHLVADLEHAAGDRARVAAVVVVLVAHRADHVLHGEAAVDQVAVGRDVDLFEQVQERGALVPRHVRGPGDDVVAVERRDRHEREVAGLERAAKSWNSDLIDSNTSWLKSTRSILLTQSTMCGTRSIVVRMAWRRLCSWMPLRASTRMSARSAVDAPVTMLRVYCTCPGVSAMMNFRLGVAK